MNKTTDNNSFHLEYYQKFDRGFKNFIKRVIRKAIKPIVYPLVSQQNHYNEQLFQKISVLEETLNNAKLEITDAKVEISNAKLAISNAKSEILDARAEISNTKSEISNTKNEILEAKSEISNVKTDLDIFEKSATYENFSSRLFEDDVLLKNINNKSLHFTTCYGDWNKVHLGLDVNMDNTMFNTNSGEIFIGDYTFTGQNVSIITGSHDYTQVNRFRAASILEDRNIIIGNGVWIGSGSIILGPCEIGDNAVVAAGSVVLPNTKIEANSLYAGIPAAKKKDLPLDENTFNFYPFGSEKSPDLINLLPYMYTNNLSEKKADEILLHKNGLVFGPYMNVLKGEYKLRINCENLTSELFLTVTVENGAKQISSFALKNGENLFKIGFDEEKNRNVEFVINSSEEFIVTAISIER